MGVWEEMQDVARRVGPRPPMPRLQSSLWVPRGVAYRMAVPDAHGRPEAVVLVNEHDLADLRADWERLHGDIFPGVRDAAIAAACEQTFRQLRQDEQTKAAKRWGGITTDGC
jgi:hypothetical protein